MKLRNISIIIFIISLSCMLSLIKICNVHQEKIQGAAIEGYVDDGQYYIMTSETEYVEVEKSEYYFSLFAWILLFILAV